MASIYVVLLVALLPGALCQLFRDSPASNTVLTNFPTTLSCAAPDPSPPFAIVWTLNDVLATSDGRVNITYDGSTGISEYQISSVSYFDDGSYQCFAIDSQGEIISESNVAILTVQGIPAFASIPPVTAPLGGEAVFECQIFSNPPVLSTSWSFHDQFGVTRALNFTSSGRVIVTQSSVTITSIQVSDEGFYDCTAENAFGRNTTSGRLFIGDSPSPLLLTISPSAPGPIIINETDSLVLTCSISDSVQVSSIQWLRGTTPVTTGVTQTTDTLLLSVTSATFEDGGVYSCTAISSTGSTVSASVSVIVQVAPMITVAPDDITTFDNEALPDDPVCLATGEPNPTIVWLHPDGSLIPVENGEPVFGILTRSDAGVYVCEASNNAGTDRAEFTITVQGPPVFLEAPMDTEASSGQDVRLTCISEGPPEPKNTWSRVGDGGLPDNSISTETELFLFSVTTDASGTYMCVAQNDFGEVSQQFSVTVLDPPMIVSATDEITVLIGQSFTLDCTTTGPPSSILTWHLNGSLLAPSSDPTLSVFPNGSLAVSNPSASYSGQYTCNISTSFAFASTQIAVTVGAIPEITVAPLDSDLAPGEGTFLDCLSNGIPQPLTSWFKTDELGVRMALPIVGDTFTIHTTGLELHDVSRVDSGTFECVVNNSLGSATESVRLRVEGTPLATSISPSQVIASDNATLSCNVLYNFPAANTSWRRADGLELASDQRFTVEEDGSLTIAPVLATDQVEYVCRVSNSYGASETNATLIVNVQPDILLLPSNQITAVLDANATLSCPTVGRPIPTITWRQSDGTDPFSSNLNQQLSASLNIPSHYIFNSASGELLIHNVVHQDSGVFTCMASNEFGSDSADIEVEVRGAAVSSLTAQPLGASLMGVSWTAPPSQGAGIAGLVSYELLFGAVRDPGRQMFIFNLNRLQYVALGLSAGTEYEVVVTGLYANGIRGLETVAFATTSEATPSGPPENIIITPLEEAMEITWTLPAAAQQNGVITSYNIFYRVNPREDNATIAASFPFTLIEYARENQTDVNHTLVVEGLEGWEVYDVKIQAGNAVGLGPNSTIVNATTLRRRVYTPFPFQLTQTLIIAVSASLIGLALVVIIIMAMSLLWYASWRRVKREGKHRPLVEEQEFDRRQKKNKDTRGRKIISGPIPGITPHIDSSVQGKFTVQSKDGNVIPLNPKIITEADVAPPPVPGENVKKVPRKDILKSRDDDNDFYTVPSDSLGEHKQSDLAVQVRSGGGSIKRTDRTSGIYSEPSTERRAVIQGETGITPYAESRRAVTSEGGEGGKGGDMWGSEAVGRGAAEESPTREWAEQSPSHETTRDDLKLIYASVSADHISKKRQKKLKEQQKRDLKSEKDQRRMQDKMERETKKREAKARKEAEKEAKRLGKDQELRHTLGLENVVRMHEVDFSSKEGKAQAQFIDAATAAIF